jgi:glucosamine--fructose-6-phosphate aminotransferase (isomerizing)
MVHNGVIENFGTLKRFLTGKGIEFKSETDSEVLCNLIAYHYSELSDGEDRFVEAVRTALLSVGELMELRSFALIIQTL